LGVAREKFQTLTEQMFYILLCLQSECYGMDIMEKVRAVTGGRVSVGPGTLYNLLESFVKAEMIRETKVEGRRRSYLITDTGRQTLEEEYRRLMTLAADYRQYGTSKGGSSDESDKA
jgi:DNA-binding PadR family transcriptional regulator